MMTLKEYTKLLGVVFFVVAAVSCSQKLDVLEDILVLDPEAALENLPLSELAKEIRYVPLENHPESMLVNVQEIIIRKNYLYAVDRILKAVFVFDHQGKYIGKLTRLGEGPGEYQNMQHVLVDEDESFIDVFEFRSGRSRILRFSNLDFELLEEISVFLPQANSLRKDQSGRWYYFSAQQLDNEINDQYTNADLIVVDGESMKPTLFFEKRIETEGSYYTANSESFSINDKGDLFFSRMFDNCFYHLSEGGVSSFLTVDFGEKGLDPSLGLKSTREQMEFLYSKEEGRGLASFPVLNFYNEKFLAITYNYKDSGGHFHVHQFLKFNSNAMVVHTRNFINDLTSFPETLYICSYSNGINHPVYFNGDLVEVVSPAYAMKESQVDIPGLGTVGREDNPILVFITPKIPLESGD
ncbi:6-bladed beta-propeller [Lunatimonas salinarum]|uniref:6-bladed beta-propeller n=1 Tax=Lunatimonas salinarum TaxID=1774590 RepID=UPI001AE01B91|nr:6-bladed beta-propeller [Lunatimonas salinarum]